MGKPEICEKCNSKGYGRCVCENAPSSCTSGLLCSPCPFCGVVPELGIPNTEVDMTHDEKMRIEAAEAQGWSGPWRFGNTHLHGTPPHAEKPATDWTDDEHVPEKVDALVHRLCSQITTLAAGIEAVRALMNDSHGVAGLHLNGDVATWEELEENGRLWEWLISFNAAECVLPNNSMKRGE